MLHQMAAGVIDDQVMRDAVAVQLPRGQLRALVAGAGFIDKDMHRDACSVGVVDRAGRGAPVHGRKPPCVAMGQNVDRPRLAGSYRLDDLQPMQADLAVDLHILIADLSRALRRRLGPQGQGQGG